MMRPIVSVLIANYEYGRYIEDAIVSAMEQTMQRRDYEIVVVDDGSTDDSVSRLRALRQEIIFIETDHRGLPAASNTGISVCRGQYLVRLDSDDQLMANSLERYYETMSANECDFVITDRFEVYSDGTQRIVRVDPHNIFTFIAAGVLFRTSSIVEVGCYRDFFWEEHDLMIRYKARFPKGAHIAEPLYRYRRHGLNITERVAKREEGWKELINEWGIDQLLRFGHDRELEDIASTTGSFVDECCH